MTRQTLRTKYIKLHQNVYAPIGLDLDAAERVRGGVAVVPRQRHACWKFRLLPCMALDGCQAMPRRNSLAPRQPGPPGILIHRGDIADDEICLVQSTYWPKGNS